MKRWWDDPAYAAGALERVDGSDVAQGVGTAVLGYHALAKAAVADLPGSTLVDPALVRARLAGVDLEPVAKALAAATEPLMGEASGRYGELLAADLHEQSMAGVDQLLAQARASQIPMPLALERVAEVVGVPPRHLGDYAKIVKTPQVPPVVKADAADRALMLYAAHLGAREETGSVPEPVVKSAFGFQEAEHPRDGEGRFALKEADPRKERAERRARRAARTTSTVRTMEARSRAQQLEQAKTLADMARALAPRAQARESGRQQQARTSLREMAARVMPARAEAAPAAPAVREAAPVAEPAMTTAADATHFALTEHLPRKLGEHVTVLDTTAIGHREQSMIVPMDVAEQIAAAGGFTTGILEMMYGGQIGDLHLFSADAPTNDVWNWAAVNGITANPDLVVLTFDGPLPVRAGDYDDDHGIQLATDSRWELTNEGEQEEWIVPRDPMGPLGKPDEVLPVLRFSNANAEDYENDQKIIKAHAEQWHDRGVVLVSRDAEGQFATQDHVRQHMPEAGPDAERRARMERRARRAARAEATQRALRVVRDEPERAAPARESARAAAPRSQARLDARQVAERVLAARGLTAVETKAPPRPRKRATAGLSNDQLVFAGYRGSVMTLDSARELVEGFDDLLELSHPRTLRMDVFDRQDLHDYGVRLDERRGNARELLGDYIEGALGGGTHVQVVHGYPTRSDAVHEARQLREDAEALDAAAAPVFLPVHDPQQGWGVRVVSHEDDPPITFYGDPKAMHAFETGGLALDFEVTAEHTGDLARHHHVQGMLGDQDVRIVAVKVSLPHDGD